MTCFVCGAPIVEGWPVTFAYIVMDGGPAFAEHNFCAAANDDPTWQAKQKDQEYRAARYRLAAMAVAA